MLRAHQVSSESRSRESFKHPLAPEALAPEALAPAAQSQSLSRQFRLHANEETWQAPSAASQSEATPAASISDQLQQHQFVQLRFHFYQAIMHDMADSSSHMPASICSSSLCRPSSTHPSCNYTNYHPVDSGPPASTYSSAALSIPLETEAHHFIEATSPINLMESRSSLQSYRHTLVPYEHSLHRRRVLDT